MHEELKVDFPVYAIFTKMDLVEGFTQYFADLDEMKRQAVWGATFQTLDKKANNVGKVPEEIDLLIQRISERMPERLQEELDLRSRAILFGFPAQLGAIRKPIAISSIASSSATATELTAILRGFYFTSARGKGRRSTPSSAPCKDYGVQSLGADRILGDRQELLPARPLDEGDLRRGRVGFDQHRRRAQIVALKPRRSR